MATLTRTRTTPTSTERLNLDTNIPTPFPSYAEWEHEAFLDDLAAEELNLEQVLPIRTGSVGGRGQASEGQSRNVTPQVYSSSGEQAESSSDVTVSQIMASVRTPAQSSEGRTGSSAIYCTCSEIMSNCFERSAVYERELASHCTRPAPFDALNFTYFPHFYDSHFIAHDCPTHPR